jgi:sugar (pentulose or hexulose) kinase
VLGRPLRLLPAADEVVARGAASLAFTALNETTREGFFCASESEDDAASEVVMMPNADRQRQYEQLYPVWREAQSAHRRRSG